VSSLLEVEELNVWFDLPHGGTLHAVQGVSFTLDRGERLGLVGESGCGKSTTVLGLLGLLPPSAELSGRVLLDGVDILAGGEESVRPHRWVDLAIVFQGAMNALNPVQTVQAQIAEALEVHGLASGRAARARVGELLESVGIPRERGERYPHEFSGGMRQRAAIAMALACNPSVLVADEPTTALDVMVQAQILELLDALCRDFGLALLLVTHDLPVVAQLCDRSAVMYAGEIVEHGPVDALFHDPRHPYTRLLFAATPDLHGNGAPVSIPGAPPRLDRPLVGCPFHERCDRAFGRCTLERPLLRGLGGERAAACHLNDVPAGVV
jgi:oligopeptide/dipeptide ABC transporter ATP-binding protein